MKTDAYEMPDSVRLVQIAYSGGKASEVMLDKVLIGEITLPPAVRLIVTCANPGMENPRTHFHTRRMEQRCKLQGIPFLRAEVDLYRGLMEAKAAGATRFDFPAFYTRDRQTGKIGMLKQRCTEWCKIAPMDRIARHWMDANMGISKHSKRIGEKILCKWIGFAFDEVTRIKMQDSQKYVCFDYPLANLRLKEADLWAHFERRNLPVPPRSVCAGCFANDAEFFEEMFNDRPSQWAQAVAVDEMIRDLTQFDVRDECFVFAGCIPLAPTTTCPSTPMATPG